MGDGSGDGGGDGGGGESDGGGGEDGEGGVGEGGGVGGGGGEGGGGGGEGGGDDGGVEPVHTDAPEGAPPSGNANLHSTPSRDDGVERSARISVAEIRSYAFLMPSASRTRP